MKTSTSTINGLVIEYDSGIVPPPYSHVFRLLLNWKDGNLSTELDLHYTDREDLSKEEILDEGFTENDDYSYRGRLNPIWTKPVTGQLAAAKWTGKAIDEGGLTVAVLENGKAGPVRVPADQEGWQLLAQDLIQAIYETSKKEAPLTIKYREITHESTKDCAVTVKFSDREVLFESDEESRMINWEYAVQLLKLIFTPDYHYELAREEPGKKRGAYIECGDGFWHELGKGVVNIDDSYDAVSKIRSGFKELLG